MNEQHFELFAGDALSAAASPFRQELLRALSQPGSATELAKQHGMSRQRVGYHMRDLERSGCIAVVGERQQRGLKEKLYQVLPRVFACAPHSQAEDSPLKRQDRFSFAALLHLLGRSIWQLALLRERADAAGKRLATLALDAELHFASPAQRQAFTEDLLDAVEAVLRKHERAPSAETRSFRMVLGAFPSVQKSQLGEPRAAATETKAARSKFQEGEQQEPKND